MASAAAVAADEARSPMSNDIGGDYGKEGEVTSGIYAKDEEAPDVNGNAEDDDEDEDLPSNPLRGSKRPRPTQDPDEDQEEEADGGDDLFGDEEDGAGEEGRPIRQLNDEELDSGDDMERLDRVPDEAEPEPEYIAQEKITMDLEYPRLPGPQPSDGEMYLLKVPSFMAIEPNAWHHTTFQPPTTNHHNFGRTVSDTFSAHKTALSTIRWRHSPSNPEQLQSNARILRWSDGSLTLQLASDPTTQYEIDGKAVAPPQRNPIKPTPTSVHQGQRGGRQGMGASDEKFDSRKDGFTYLLRPYDENGTMVVTQKVTTGLTVRAPQGSEGEDDEALAKLKASLAAANASKFDGDNMNLVAVEENPEQARLNALAAMKDIEKKNKRTLAAQEREAARANRTLGRSGLGSNRYGGLNASMLEDDEEGGGGRARPSPHKRAKPRRRRNSEYSEDEDFGRKRFSREDEYEEDDFLVGSDEEEEVVDDDDDPDDGIVEEERPRSGKGRERTPKRWREDDDDEADAEGEDDEDEGPSQAAGRGQVGVKKRRVVDDEDEDE